jgi:hypothetical protein
MQLQIEIQPIALRITSWRTMGEKAPKSYDVQVKQTYFWANQGQPTPCSLQNLIHVSLVESPTKIEENCILRTFQTKIHHGLIQSRN